METIIDTRKMKDNYSALFNTEAKLAADVVAMEENSRWIPAILSKEMVIKELPDPMFADGLPFDPDLMEDTKTMGTGLYLELPNGQQFLIRNTAPASLYTRASIEGAALGRLPVGDLATVLNLCLSVSKGSSLLLERYGKISAFHSDASDGYRIMPISTMLQIVRRELKDRFGTLQFLGGLNSHEYTSASWALPDVADELIFKYEQQLHMRTKVSIDDMMPVVRFVSSDTAGSSATAIPMFQLGKHTMLRLTDGIVVKHTRGSKMDGVELFEDQVKSLLFAKFEESIEAAARLSEITIANPCNVVVGICGKCRIPKKYGEAARAQVESFMVTEPCLSAHDIYLSFCEAVGLAKENGASDRSVSNMEESICTLLRPSFDWSAYDVGGIVPWGTSTQS